MWCIPCPRVLTKDAGGTDIETWPLRSDLKFRCTIQPVKRRPVSGVTGDVEVDMMDAVFVYPANITLDQTSRISVNDVVYTIREVYDNVNTAMTNQAYLARV